MRETTALTASNAEGFLVINTTRDLTWSSDEPIELGGSDQGPKPTELLLSALASCKLITVRMYAQRKGWELKSTSVALKIVDQENELTTIEKRIRFEGNLSDEQRARLLEISGRCPVVKMLSKSITFQIK